MIIPGTRNWQHSDCLLVYTRKGTTTAHWKKYTLGSWNVIVKSLFCIKSWFELNHGRRKNCGWFILEALPKKRIINILGENMKKHEKFTLAQIYQSLSHLWYLFSKHRPSGPMLSISWNVRLCVRVFVSVFTFEVPFKRLFAPTSRSRMSNIFRDSESLGKSSGKKWSHIWTFLFENCLKLPRKKKFVFWLVLPYKTW